MAVPFIDLRRFEDDFLERWQHICDRISRATQFVGGPEAEQLESSLRDRAEVASVVGCANGTDALQLALRALGVGRGDTVIIPDSTFWATFEAVVNVGADVVTVDIDPDDLQMDYQLLLEAVDAHRPQAVILVHLYGWGSARLNDIRKLCLERDIPLIEDGAQAIGVKWQGHSIYQASQLATVSFYPAKVLGSCGDAGAVYCNPLADGTDPATEIRQLGNHGRTSHYGHGLVGWNSRMGGFDAAFLNLSLEYLDRRLADRRRLAEAYRSRLGDLQIDPDKLRVMGPPEGYEENGYLNVLRVEPRLRLKLQDALQAEGIGFGNVYPGAMSKQPGAGPFLKAAVGGEQAQALADSVLNLPLFAYMRQEEFDQVLDVVEKSMHDSR